MKPNNSTKQPRYDTIVIGSGIAGLAAADRLKSNEINYLILEADAHPGGRAISRYHAETEKYFDHGASFILPTYSTILDLCRRYGIQPVKIQQAGLKLAIMDGEKLQEFPESISSLLFSNYFTILQRIRIILAAILVPVALPIAILLSPKISISRFSNMFFGHAFTAKLLDPICRNLFLYDTTNISVKMLLRLLPYARKLEFHNLPEGIGQLTQTMADNLNCEYNQRVQSISRVNEIFIIKTENRKYEAQNIIVATPANITAKLLANIDPDLSTSLQSISYSSHTKIFAKCSKESGEIFEKYDRLLFQNEDDEVFSSLNLISRSHDELIFSIGLSHVNRSDPETLLKLITTNLKKYPTLTDLTKSLEILDVAHWDNALPQFIEPFQSKIQGIKICGDYVGGPFLEGAAGSGVIL